MSDDVADSSSASPPRGKARRRVLWGTGVVLALAVVAYLAVPPIARHYAQKILAETLGREVGVERVEGRCDAAQAPPCRCAPWIRRTSSPLPV